MKPLDRHSERVRPSGNFPADGIIKQLGRPDMDRLELLVRESAQNSWDAGLNESGPVHYSIDLKSLNKQEADVLNSFVFNDTPQNHSLSEQIEEGEMLLLISDRNTCGLDGPTRADHRSEEDENNFVDFVRNIGQPRDKVQGGGTYGFGKISYFLASQIQTVLIHSRTTVGDRPVSRFIASALGEKFTDHNDNRFTGRHWWGEAIEDNENFVEPITGERADRLAEELRVPPYDLGNGKGTTIGIMLPDFGDRAIKEILEFLRHSLMMNLWPKMVTTGEKMPDMTFRLSHNGNNITLPDPREYSPIKGFVRAYRNLESSSDGSPVLGEKYDISFGGSKYASPADIGTLSLSHFHSELETVRHNDVKIAPTPPIRHVALMRQAELVVRYFEGPAPEDESMHYAGVFRVREEVSSSFAQSEPPTHDDWNYKGLESGETKSYVRKGLNGVQKYLREFTQHSLNPDAEEISGSLGSLSSELGTLIPGAEGMGAEVSEYQMGENDPETSDSVQDSNGDNKSEYKSDEDNEGEQNVRLEILDGPKLDLIDDEKAIRFKFDLENRDGQSIGVRVRTDVVVDENGVERDPPESASEPEVMFWKDSSGIIGENKQVDVPEESTGPWKVAIRVPGEYAVRTRISVEE